MTNEVFNSSAIILKLIQFDDPWNFLFDFLTDFCSHFWPYYVAIRNNKISIKPRIICCEKETIQPNIGSRTVTIMFSDDSSRNIALFPLGRSQSNGFLFELNKRFQFLCSMLYGMVFVSDAKVDILASLLFHCLLCICFHDDFSMIFRFFRLELLHFFLLLCF